MGLNDGVKNAYVPHIYEEMALFVPKVQYSAGGSILYASTQCILGGYGCIIRV